MATVDCSDVMWWAAALTCPVDKDMGDWYVEMQMEGLS